MQPSSQQEKTLGQGTFGKVKLGIHSKTGQKVAVKILEKKKIADVSDIQRVQRQIHILKLVRHPNLIQLYQIIQTPKYLFLVMQYCSGGQLFDYIAEKKRLNQRQACRFFHQIIDGVDYLHRLGIVHRDLKPQNMLLDHNKNIKIVDFGLSNTYTPIVPQNNQIKIIQFGQNADTPQVGVQQVQKLKTACGSPCYAAPEMIAGKKYIGLQVDLWSCGVILFAMICGTLPFEDPNTSALYKKILTLSYKIPKDISSFAKQIIKGLLTNTPDRISLSQIRSHEFYRIHNQDIVSGIVVGRDYIPIDNNILSQTARLGYDTAYTRQCLLTNKHNAATTAYYLLLKQRHQAGFNSIADINSSRFDPSLLVPSFAKPKFRISSVDKLLQLQRVDQSIIPPRKTSVGINISKRYGRPQSKRKQVRSQLQKSYQNPYSNLNTSAQKVKISENVINLPSLTKRNHRKVYLAKQ